MYGLEKKAIKEELYDLEKEWKNGSTASKWRTRIDSRIEEVKDLIRKGSNPQEFHALEHLLQGYMALKKIMGRVK